LDADAGDFSAFSPFLGVAAITAVINNAANNRATKPMNTFILVIRDFSFSSNAITIMSQYKPDRPVFQFFFGVSGLFLLIKQPYPKFIYL
jgi:hypothetical protein